MTPEILARCARAAQVRCGKDLIDITLGIVDESYTPSIGMELILSYAVAFADAAIAQEREAHRYTVKMAAELLDEIRAQWSHDYLWKKWGLDEQIAAIRGRMP